MAFIPAPSKRFLIQKSRDLPRLFTCISKSGSLYPATITRGKAAIADRVVARGFQISPHGHAYSLIPLSTHAAAGVTAETAATSIGSKSCFINLGGQIVLMHPLRRSTDNIIAVLQHEGMGIRVAEIIE